MSKFVVRMPMNKNKYIYSLIILLSGVSLNGCFTGIESTPAITKSDLKREHITLTEEQTFLQDIQPEKPAQWTPGKEFYVTDEKISYIFTSDQPIDTAALKGSVLRLADVRPAQSMMGSDIAVIELSTPSGQILRYRTNKEYDDVYASSHLDIPFTIDVKYIDDVKSKLKGNNYYISTPLWYERDGKTPIKGQRYIEVTVLDVLPGDSNYPFRIEFCPTNTPEKIYNIYLTVGSSRSATRNFDTLFSFENPRKRYPQITDETWQLITNSKVQIGMTKEECRLALGSPKNSGEVPTTAGMVEFWGYADGTNLMFADGRLESYRK